MLIDHIANTRKATGRAARVAALLVLALPGSAAAGTPDTREPILTLEGFQPTCSISSGLNTGLAEVMRDRGPAEPWHPAFVAAGARPLPASWIRGWRGSDKEGYGKGYDQCIVSPDMLARRLYAKLVAFRDEIRAEDPTVDRIDVVGASYGSLISRLCITTVAGCAELIDDWVGIVPPSHGSTSWISNCWLNPYTYVCRAANPTGSVILRMNANDGGTPYGSDQGGWIDYSTLRATEDGVIAPAGSERLPGAANWYVTIPASTTGRPTVTTHANWSGVGNPDCGGSSRTSQTGAGEALAAELADVTDRTAWNLATADSFDQPLPCGRNVLDPTTESGDATEPGDSAGSGDATESSDSAESGDATEPGDSAESGESAGSAG
ncbi:MAG: hypothetical protein QM679_06900 [Patulibacter sp.]